MFNRTRFLASLFALICLFVCLSGQECTFSDQTVNRFPLADAGGNILAAPGSRIDLVGDGSSDPDGDPLSYLWSQVSGPQTVTIEGFDQVRASVQVPVEGIYEFRLTVDDGRGGVASAAVVVFVTSESGNTAPTSLAGDDQEVQAGATVTLDGSGSSDPDGDVLVYTWKQISGPSVTLSDSSAAKPSFVCPQVAETTDLVFELTVSDGQLDDIDTVTITVKPDSGDNLPPIVADQMVTTERGIPVAITLKASDPDGDAFILKVGTPAHGTLTGTPPAVVYTPEAGYLGQDSFVFKANDGRLDSGTATVTITINEKTIQSSQTVSGLIESLAEEEKMMFSGWGGQRIRILLTRTSGNLDPYVRLFSPDSDSGVEDYAAADSSGLATIDRRLATTGQYTIVVSDFRGEKTGGYNLTFLKLAGPLTNSADPDGGSISSAQTLAGAIGLTSDMDAFTLAGTVNHRVRIIATRTTGDLEPTLRLYPPGVDPVEATGETVDGSVALIDHKLAALGEYTIVVENLTGAKTGGYDITFLDLGGALTSSMDADGGDILSGQTIAGNIDAPSDSDAFQFTAQAGQRVRIMLARNSGELEPVIRLYPTDGKPVEETASSGSGSTATMDRILAANGTYTIVVEDRQNAKIGGYNLTFINLAAGPLTDSADPDGGQILSGQTLSGEIDLASDMDAYTFSVDADDRIRIILAAGSGGLVPHVILYSPQQIAVEESASGGSDTTVIIDRKLTVKGQYTLVVNDQVGTNFGQYGVTFINLQDSLTSQADQDGGYMISGQTLSGQMNLPSDMDAFTFSGRQYSRYLILFAKATAESELDPYMRLYPPDSEPAEADATSGFGSSAMIDRQLLYNGTYTIVLRDLLGARTGGYSLTLVNLTNGPLTSETDKNGGSIGLGAILTGQINLPADMDVFTFTGYQNQDIKITMTTTAGEIEPYMLLYPPYSGPMMDSAAGNADSPATLERKLSSTGRYLIVLRDLSGAKTGSYRLVLEAP